MDLNQKQITLTKNSPTLPDLSGSSYISPIRQEITKIKLTSATKLAAKKCIRILKDLSFSLTVIIIPKNPFTTFQQNHTLKAAL